MDPLCCDTSVCQNGQTSAVSFCIFSGSRRKKKKIMFDGALRTRFLMDGGLYLFLAQKKGRACECNCLELCYDYLTATVQSNTCLEKVAPLTSNINFI